MRRKISIGIFIIILLSIIAVLFYTGQEHTLIVDNKYKNKNESKNISFKLGDEKEKKVSKDKKIVLDVKGMRKSFTLIIDGKEIKGELYFNYNKGGELNIEKFLKGEENWLVPINQY